MSETRLFAITTSVYVGDGRPMRSGATMHNLSLPLWQKEDIPEDLKPSGARLCPGGRFIFPFA